MSDDTFTLEINAKAWKDGPDCPTVYVPGFPMNPEKAVQLWGEDTVMAMIIRAYSVPVQQKQRNAYNGKRTGVRTKGSNSPVAQQKAAKQTALQRRRDAMAAAEVAAKTEATAAVEQAPEDTEEYEETEAAE